MFEVNGVYANRIGQYTVLALAPPKMTVRYDDGSVAELNIRIQERIWENIAAEMESQKSSRISRARGKSGTPEVQYYVKSISIIAQEEISASSWREKMTIVAKPGPTILPSSRIIYYAVENQTFFSVATVTGVSTAKPPKGFFFPGKDPEDFAFYPIDMDVAAQKPEHGVSDESVELESQPDFKRLLAAPETYLSISEDDFELLAELLSEATEEEETDDENEDEEYDD